MPKSQVQLLLVEDNIDQRELTLRAFRMKDPTLQITAVENGTVALEMLSRGHFDAIILDYSLPRMNGLEVLGQIRREGYTIPVIMVTGHGDEKIAVEAMKGGASDYIIKTRNYYETLPVAVEKVIQKYQLERHLDEASLRARGLYEVSLAVTKERRVETLAATLVEGTRQLMQVEGALLFLIDSESSEVKFMTFSGIEVAHNALLGPVTATGLFGLAYTEQHPVVIEAPDQHPLWGATPVHQPLLRQLLTVPLLRQGGGVGGVLSALNKQGAEPFSQEDINTLSTLAVHAAVAIDNARFLEEMEKQAVTDSLTGFYNHREFQKRLTEEVERGSRYGKEFSLLMLDIDHFKVFNDTHGHPVGDAILKEIVRIIRKCIRTVDLPARYGGEEFTIILPETTGEKAKIVAERIRQSIGESPFALPSDHPVHLSVSVGIASFPVDADSRDGLIIATDQALYFAKEGGRNRVCRYSETLKSAIEKDQDKLAEILLDPKMKTIRDLAAAIDAKTPYTRGHTEGILQYAVLLADALNLGEEERKSLQLASLLHNIGMVGIPDTLLNKPGPLSVEELKIIRAHPSLAQILLKESTRLDSVLPAILYHHERYDGNGYPSGLRGEEIPFLARVLGVVEAYQAMLSVRPYRPKMTQQQAIEELRRNAGSQFDPRVVETFVNLLKAPP